MSFHIGIDIGAVSLKLAAICESFDAERMAAVTDGGDSFFSVSLPTSSPCPPMLLSSYRQIQSSLVNAVCELLNDLYRRVPRQLVHGIRVTGSGVKLIAGQLSFRRENEFRALAKGIRFVCPEVRTVLLVLAAVLVLMAAPSAVLSQSSPWPQIPTEELALKDNPKNPGAAAILLDREVVDDDPKNTRTERYRIKVFKEEGKSYADVIIPYRPHLIEVRDIRARTVHADGTTVEFAGQIFDRTIVKSKRLKYQAKAFTLSGVETGSIIEYSYSLHWRDAWPQCIKNPRECWITGAYSMPTGVWVIQHELYTRHARFFIRPLPKANLFWATIRLPNGADLQKQNDGSVQLELRDIAPLDKEDYRPPEDMLNSRVHLYYGINISPSGPPELFWNDYGKREGENLDAFMGNYKSIQRATAETVGSNDAREEKLRKIYRRVQQLRYLSYEGWFTEKEQRKQDLKDNKNVEDVLKHGYAYTNDINYLFVAMARAAGFQANVVELVDRSRSVFDPIVLDPSRLNASVVMVRVGQKVLFFDPATRFCPYELLPWSESGVVGIQIDKFGGTYIQTPGQPAESAITDRTAKLKLDKEGTLEGSLEVLFTGNEALTRRLESYDEDAVGRNKAIEDEVKGWLPSRATVKVESGTVWESSDNELRAKCQISVPQFAEIIGRRILLPGAVFQSTRTNPLQHPTRTYPVYFRFAFQELDNLDITLPEGFSVEGVPKVIDANSSTVRFSSRFTVHGTDLEFHRSFTVNGLIFPLSYYPALRAGFDQVANSDKEKVVLQKLETARRP